MLRIVLILFSIFIISCGNSSERNNDDLNVGNIPNVEVIKSELMLNGNEGNWYYKNELFNGYLVNYDADDKLIEKVGFYNGKKEGIAKIWFSNGQIKVESHYHKNKLVDSYKAWWSNGILASESYYVNGLLQGIERKWYDSGQLSKQLNYTDNKENGMQQAWLRNGKLYVNYEAKNGRIFGMRKANLCYQLEDEVVVEDTRSIATFGKNKDLK